eukprot:TRINITY_DN13569_c0_g1_i3.p1 TRINITY_DN13569_c0_g1~~TRINITY_DN13569_c0_g1_i3.p1  ORF type:complete len:198 (+),score=36.12 TRINITY_DN13569_c0_g1_i3:66-659(+)
MCIRDSPYSCPLCFRYFNHMLQCSKCKNYACRFCADDIGNRCLEVLVVAHCPFCDASPFVVADVDKNEPVKKYTDTPYSSCISGFRFSGRAFHQQRDFRANQKGESVERKVKLIKPLGTVSNFANKYLMEQEEDNKFRRKSNSLRDMREVLNISTGDKENALDRKSQHNLGWDNSFEYNVIRPVSYTHLTLPTICSV